MDGLITDSILYFVLLIFYSGIRLLIRDKYDEKSVKKTKNMINNMLTAINIFVGINIFVIMIGIFINGFFSDLIIFIPVIIVMYISRKIIKNNEFKTLLPYYAILGSGLILTVIRSAIYMILFVKFDIDYKPIDLGAIPVNRGASLLIFIIMIMAIDNIIRIKKMKGKGFTLNNKEDGKIFDPGEEDYLKGNKAYKEKDGMKNYTAFQMYKKSAEAGYLPAYFSLGYCYLYGEGTTRNYIEAYKWFKIAEINGREDKREINTEMRLEAESFLTIEEKEQVEKELRNEGTITESPIGNSKIGIKETLQVMKNSDNEIGKNNTIYDKNNKYVATETEYEEGLKYYKGIGVIQDYVESYIRFNIAAAICTEEMRDEISKYRDEVAEKLGKEDLIIAQKESKLRLVRM